MEKELAKIKEAYEALPEEQKEALRGIHEAAAKATEVFMTMVESVNVIFEQNAQLMERVAVLEELALAKDKE